MGCMWYKHRTILEQMTGYDWGKSRVYRQSEHNSAVNNILNMSRCSLCDKAVCTTGKTLPKAE